MALQVTHSLKELKSKNYFFLAKSAFYKKSLTRIILYNAYFSTTHIFLQCIIFYSAYFSTTHIFLQRIFFYNAYFSTTHIFLQRIFFYNAHFHKYLYNESYFCVGHLCVLTNWGVKRAAETELTKLAIEEVSHTAKILLVKASFFFRIIPSSGEIYDSISATDLKGTNRSKSKESVSIENWKMTFLS